jgi:hypothetical protein
MRRNSIEEPDYPAGRDSFPASKDFALEPDEDEGDIEELGAINLHSLSFMASPAYSSFSYSSREFVDFSKRYK